MSGAINYKGLERNARRKRAREMRSADGKTCEDCGADALYGVFIASPTPPTSRQIIVEMKAAYYCEEHAHIVETRCPVGAMRRLTPKWGGKR